MLAIEVRGKINAACYIFLILYILGFILHEHNLYKFKILKVNMFKKKKRKFCPKCGAELKLEDKYCTACSYSFEKRKKKFKFKNILIIIIILIILWIVIRLVLNKPLIPFSLTNIFGNTTS